MVAIRVLPQTNLKEIYEGSYYFYAKLTSE